MKSVLILVCFLSVFSGLYGQPEPKHTFTVELGMPVPVSNNAFRWLMKSQVACSPYYQYRLRNSLAFGAGLNYTYLQIDRVKVPSSEAAKGGVHSVGAFVKAAHEKFHNDRFATDLGVKVGYSQHYFVTDLNNSIYGKAQQVGSVSVTPMLGLILNVDEFSSYRFTLGYMVQGYSFTNQRMGIQTNGAVVPTNATTQCLIVGFGFTHYFSKNKNTGE